MTKINFKTINCIQNNYLNKSLLQKINKDYAKLEKEIFSDINNSDQTLNILSKKYKFSFRINDIKKYKKYKNIVVIGMGGSILGAEAIYGFLEKKIKKKFYFFDDLNSKKNINFKKKIKSNKTLFIIISKSGETTETLSNLISLGILKKNSKNIITISEKNKNTLYNISQKFNLFHIEHNKNVGGRYSVLSEVGIIPAYLMGVNILNFRSNILSFTKNGKGKFLKESVKLLVNLLKRNKIKNLVFLNYSPELENFLFWCQQLLAESLGKKEKGFLPIISSAPKDHHSLLQLYLDGPKDKLFYIFSIDEEPNVKIITKNVLNKKHFLNKKTIKNVKDAQKNALIETLKKKNIPFREFIIKKINETVLGEMFSYFILETVLIGKLIKINPYDQPAVEQVKILTKKLLN